MGIPWRPEVEKKLPLAGYTVMVNPGHGEKKGKGTAVGTKGKLGRKTIFEMDLNDKVALNVQRKLEKMGANVIYVDNTPIKQIRDLENQHHPNVFVAIHHDAKGSASSLKSGETIYAWGQSTKVAKYINKEFNEEKTIPNNGVNLEKIIKRSKDPNKKIKTPEELEKKSKGLTVLQGDSTINAVLVEGGFVSNKNELKILNTKEYQNIEAQCITDGIKKFLTAKTKHKEIELKRQKEAEFKKKVFWTESLKDKAFKLPYTYTGDGTDI